MPDDGFSSFKEFNNIFDDWRIFLNEALPPKKEEYDKLLNEVNPSTLKNLLRLADKAEDATDAARVGRSVERAEDTTDVARAGRNIERATSRELAGGPVAQTPTRPPADLPPDVFPTTSAPPAATKPDWMVKIDQEVAEAARRAEEAARRTAEEAARQTMSVGERINIVPSPVGEDISAADHNIDMLGNVIVRTKAGGKYPMETAAERFGLSTIDSGGARPVRQVVNAASEMHPNMPELQNKFILNSIVDEIPELNNVKIESFLGAGDNGIAYNLEDGRVFKIFEARKPHDLEWYSQLSNRRDPTDLVVHGHGDLGHIRPDLKWVIMEKLTPITDLIPAGNVLYDDIEGLNSFLSTFTTWADVTRRGDMGERAQTLIQQFDSAPNKLTWLQQNAPRPDSIEHGVYNSLVGDLWTFANNNPTFAGDLHAGNIGWNGELFKVFDVSVPSHLREHKTWLNKIIKEELRKILIERPPDFDPRPARPRRRVTPPATSRAREPRGGRTETEETQRAAGRDPHIGSFYRSMIGSRWRDQGMPVPETAPYNSDPAQRRAQGTSWHSQGIPGAYVKSEGGWDYKGAPEAVGSGPVEWTKSVQDVLNQYTRRAVDPYTGLWRAGHGGQITRRVESPGEDKLPRTVYSRDGQDILTIISPERSRDMLDSQRPESLSLWSPRSEQTKIEHLGGEAEEEAYEEHRSSAWPWGQRPGDMPAKRTYRDHAGQLRQYDIVPSRPAELPLGYPTPRGITDWARGAGGYPRNPNYEQVEDAQREQAYRKQYPRPYDATWKPDWIPTVTTPTMWPDKWFGEHGMSWLDFSRKRDPNLDARTDPENYRYGADPDLEIGRTSGVHGGEPREGPRLMTGWDYADLALSPFLPFEAAQLARGAARTPSFLKRLSGPEARVPLTRGQLRGQEDLLPKLPDLEESKISNIAKEELKKLLKEIKK